eukprot:TRINITY_DN31668_c0_g1_i1.p1 TRINITY_DN31668_c0_g1~~TRINITY_DN31668_c0_g1_i1.p1  ORF type:complete len:233 (-),score=68.98 TRINITY_DN31668_c0_g1_i1:117-815(-)
MKSDLRHQYLVGRIKDFLAVGDNTLADKLSLQMESAFGEGTPKFEVITSMLNGTGPNYLLFVYQPEVAGGEDVFQVIDPSQDTNLEVTKKCVYCTRQATGRAIPNKDVANVIQELFMGVLEANLLSSFEHLLNEVYGPLLSKSSKWGKNTDSERQHFLQSLSRYADHLGELQKPSIETNFRLQKVEDSVWRQVQSGATKNRAAAEVIPNLEAQVMQWIEACLLYTSPSPRDS